MTAAVLYPPMTTTTTPSSQQSTPTNTTPRLLHRATYVHVSDLTSAYNIDHAKLEQELTRVKTERAGTAPTATSKNLDVEETELETVLPQKRLQPPRGGFNLCV